MHKVPMTIRGAEVLQQELQYLKNKKRPQIIEAVATARAHGDLKENAEYHAAREQQGFVEARIRDIEDKLARAEIIDVRKLDVQDRVIFGATVTFQDEDGKTETTYQIVGEDEADIKQNRISYASPIARSLIGRVVGDSCIIEAPHGEWCCVITKVEYIIY